MTPRFKVYGIDEMIVQMNRLNVDVQRESRAALYAVGTFYVRKLKARLGKKGGGVTYSINRKGSKRETWRPLMVGEKVGRYAKHVASAPGSPPAVNMGQLRGSITHNVTGRIGRILPNPGGSGSLAKAYIGSNVISGLYLDQGAQIYPYGNPNLRATLEPRPWFMVTIAGNAMKASTIIRLHLQDAINRNTT